MNKSRLNTVIKLSNYYYKLAIKKYADKLKGEYISPESEYGDKEPEEEFQSLLSHPSRPARKSRLGAEDLPAYKEYEKHYANTTIDYKFIYLGNYFGLQKAQSFGTQYAAFYLDEYKDMIKNHVDLEESKDSKNINLIKEGNTLLDNFDEIFDQNAINVVVNKFDVSEDTASPEALDHDIGHRILDDWMKTNYIANIKNIIEEIKKDYIGIDIETDLPDPSIVDNLQNNRLMEMFELILIKDKLSRGISGMNIRKGMFVDLLQDLLPIYNKNAETFKGLQFKGLEFYSDGRSIEPSSSMKGIQSAQLYKYEYIIIPKNSDGSIPNTVKAINDLLEKIESHISKSLADLVGKVFILW